MIAILAAVLARALTATIARVVAVGGLDPRPGGQLARAVANERRRGPLLTSGGRPAYRAPQVPRGMARPDPRSGGALIVRAGSAGGPFMQRPRTFSGTCRRRR